MRPPIPQVQPPPPVELPAGDMQMQPPAPRPAPASRPTAQSSHSSSQGMVVPRVSLRDRSRSPMHDAMFDHVGNSEQPKDMYSRPNASNQSVNLAARSPQTAHSRNNSHDANAAFTSAESEQRQQMSPRFKNQSESPQQNSQRSSMLFQTSNTSPYGRGPSPAFNQVSGDNLSGQRPAHARVPSTHMQQEKSSSRPDSPSSNPPPFAVPKPTGSPTSRLPVFRNRQSGAWSSRPESTASLASLQGGYFPNAQ